MLRTELGVDIGSSNVRIYIKGRGIVLCEPSLVAIDKDNGRVVGVGSNAFFNSGIMEKEAEIVRPIKNGAICDEQKAQIMLQSFMKRISGNSILRPKVSVCIHGSISAVKALVLRKVCESIGAKPVVFVPVVLAAAIGAGVDIINHSGIMIVDIGSSMIDIGVISKGNITSHKCKNYGSERLSEAIENYFLMRYGIAIGEFQSDTIKQAGGIEIKDTDNEQCTVKVTGKRLSDNVPESICLPLSEIMPFFADHLQKVAVSILNVLKVTPKKLRSHVYSNGIVLTGAGAKLRGIDQYIAAKTGIHTVLAENPSECAAAGACLYENCLKNSALCLKTG